jgi:hypothetical protein
MARLRHRLSSRTTVRALTSRAVLGGKLGRDAGGKGTLDQGDDVGVGTFREPRRLDRDDGDPFEAEVGLRTHHVAHLGPVVKE